MDKSADELYQEREKRIDDAVKLKMPDSVPLMCSFGFFPARYTGISIEEAMHDYDKMMTAWVDTTIAFQPDMYGNPFGIRFLGSILKVLDYKPLKWAGHGIGVSEPFQYIDAEYMKEEEYDDFLFDLSDFMIRKYWPRVFGAFNSLKKLPPLHEIISYYLGLSHFAEFDSPEVSGAIDALLEAAKQAKRMIAGAAEYAERMRTLGFPPHAGGLCQAPFDTMTDFFRGTKGATVDMFRVPDKLLEATEKLLPVMLKLGLNAKKRGAKRVFIPLHKGLDGFLSPEQFDIFYWPTLKKLTLNLIEEGLTPMLMWEGDCTSRLEIIGDIPKGKAIYWFESTDIFKAKEVLGETVCIKGNVPLSILCKGTPDDVEEYCKKLINVIGKGGGFIMDSAAGMDDAKQENIRAMVDVTHKYGIY